MADLPFESPVTRPDPTATTGPLLLADESGLAKASVRAAEGTAAAAALGLTFGTSEVRGDLLVVRIRPDEWLLIGPADAVGAEIAGLDLAGFASHVDVTHSRLLFRFTGADAAAALAKVCSLDLADHMTPDGACAGASVAKVSCDLVRHDVDGVRSYRILCDRSYGQYLHDSLVDAAAEFTA